MVFSDTTEILQKSATCRRERNLAETGTARMKLLLANHVTGQLVYSVEMQPTELTLDSEKQR